MFLAVHSRRSGREERSAGLRRFCTQTMSVSSSARERWSSVMLLSPMPAIRPSSRAWIKAANCSSKNESTGAPPFSRRLTAASCSTWRPARLSTMAAPELVGVVVRADPAALVPAVADLGHDRKIGRVGEQGSANQVVHDIGPVVLRCVDVIDAGRDRRTEYRDRLAWIRWRAEDARAGQPHRSVAQPAHDEAAEGECRHLRNLDRTTPRDRIPETPSPRAPAGQARPRRALLLERSVASGADRCARRRAAAAARRRL